MKFLILQTVCTLCAACLYSNAFAGAFSVELVAPYMQSFNGARKTEEGWQRVRHSDPAPKIRATPVGIALTYSFVVNHDEPYVPHQWGLGISAIEWQDFSYSDDEKYPPEFRIERLSLYLAEVQTEAHAFAIKTGRARWFFGGMLGTVTVHGERRTDTESETVRRQRLAGGIKAGVVADLWRNQSAIVGLRLFSYDMGLIPSNKWKIRGGHATTLGWRWDF